MTSEEFDILGDKFGKLTILEIVKDRYSSGISVRRAVCLCECGNISIPVKSKLTRGIVSSCGCNLVESRLKFGERRRLGAGVAARNEVLAMYKKGAKSRGHSFDLTDDEFFSMVVMPCVYCGDSMGNEHKRSTMFGSFIYTGLDRYDNTKGYTVENAVPCCIGCNRMKMDMSVDDFYRRMDKIMKNSNFWKRTA